MAKGKDVRIRVILECISCVRKGTPKLRRKSPKPIPGDRRFA